MTVVSLIHHADGDKLASAVSARLHVATLRSQRLQGLALLALAGGRTAPPICRAFCRLLGTGQDVSIVPTDERWVAAGHADHNLGQLQHALGDCPGLEFLSLTPSPLPAVPSTDWAATQLSRHPQAFAASLLGMGGDGHFASLFPGAANLPEALDLHGSSDVALIHPDPLPVAGPHPRISLSLQRLLRTDCLLLAITGADKLALLQQARESDDVQRWPVVALLQQTRTPLEVHWSP